MCVVYDTKANRQLSVQASRSGGLIEISVEQSSRKPYTIVFRGIDEITSVQGAAWTKVEIGIVLTPDSGVTKLIVEL